MNYHQLDNFEEVKRIKWIVKQVAEEVKKNNFSIKFASLYLEEDEDAEVWKEHVKEWARDHWCYETLILFVMILDCDYFTLKLVINENENYFICELKDGINNDQAPVTINDIGEMRNVLSTIFDHCGYGFDQRHHTTEKAYKCLLSDFKKIGLQME